MLTLSYTDQQNLIDFLRHLIKTASFSGIEGNLAQQVAHKMEQVGFNQVKIDDMGNVIGVLGTGKPPHLLYYTHLDTVGIGDIHAWFRDPFGAVIEEDILYGRGAADPKGPLASMVYGAKLLHDNQTNLNGTLYMVCGVHGETAEGVAMRYVVENNGLQPDWVILGAPTDLQIYRGQRGRIELTVTVKGRACHAATPMLGLNAIYGAARIIFSLEMLASNLGDDPLLGVGTLAVTHIENIERTKNVIPDSCTFVVDRRLTLSETEAHALAEVQGLLAKEGVEGKVEVANVKVVSYTGEAVMERKSYPAWITDDKDSLIRQVSKSIQTVTNLKPQLGRWNFSTAGVYAMGEAGIPTLGFGPGQEHFAHTANDHIKLEDCFTAATIYAQIAHDLL